MPDVERDVTCTWVGEWADAFAACVRWSREHGHRHRIAWNAAQGGWRITCVTPPESVPCDPPCSIACMVTGGVHHTRESLRAAVLAEVRIALARHAKGDDR